MTAPEIRCAIALSSCTFPPAQWDKRFARAMGEIAVGDPGRDLTERQRLWIFKLTVRYRRQINKSVVHLAKGKLKEIENADQLTGS